MRRLVLFALPIAVLAIGVWFYFSKAKAVTLQIATLLPRETIFLADVPDFNRARDDWHHSDIYQLYREPAVQNFLRKPLASAPRTEAVTQTLNDIEQLNPKDAFVALTSIDNNKPRLLAGFRFRGNRANAEQVIEKWRANLLRGDQGAAREKITRGRHEIEAVSTSRLSFATTHAGQWFFAANDVAELQALLDRADGMKQDRESALEADEAYRRAIAHMPANYALLVYVQPKIFAEKLAALRAALGHQISTDRSTLIEQIGSVCGTLRFEHGKMHDLFFAAMPRRTDAKLSRSAETLGTTDTFFYLATLLNAQTFGPLGQVAAMAPVGGWLQRFVRGTQNSGITSEDWKAAFDLEFSALADWSPNARWPSLIVTLPVRDPPRAQKIVAALTTALDEDAIWAKTEKDGVTYFSVTSSPAVFAISPTIGLSDRLFVVGLDAPSVEAALKRSQKPTELLSNSANYKAAARALPAPTDSFAYIDTGLFYLRLDTAVRPLLMLGAAFLPAIGNDVDLAKLPPPDAITKHLSPIVSSQRYERDGYIAESVGPITANEAVLVIGLAVIYRAAAGHRPD
jgi:hypothetical protein